MSQIKRKFIENNAINGTKLRLDNNEFLRGRNAGDTGDVNILRLSATDVIEFNSVPQVAGDNLATEAYVASL